MATPEDISITIYDKAFVWKGNLADYSSLDITVKRTGLGGGTISIPSSHPLAADMLAKGARYVLQYKGVTEISGKVRSPKGGFDPTTDITFTLTDDKRILASTLAWVVPPAVVDKTRQDITPIHTVDGTPTGTVDYQWTGTATQSNKGLAPTSLSDQAQAWANSTNDPYAGAANGRSFGSPYMQWPVDGAGMSSTMTGNARQTEYLIKWLAHIHVVMRLHAPVVVAPNLDRGRNVVTSGLALPTPRFDTLLDTLEAVAALDGFRITMLQEPHTDHIVLEVSTGQVYPQKLTYESGIIVDGEWSMTDPEATRVILGGTGDDDARAFFEADDASGLEAEYGEVIETFRDSTGFTLTWASALAEDYKVPKFYLKQSSTNSPDKVNLQAYITSEGLKGLDAGAPTSGVSFELSETESFYYGGAGGFKLGDQMTASAAGVDDFTDLLESVQFTVPAAGGLTVKPVIGSKTDDPDEQLAASVVALAKAMTRLRTQQ